MIFMYVARMEETRKLLKILVGNLQDHIHCLERSGRMALKCEGKTIPVQACYRIIGF